jgi:hypothetical protein
MPLLLARNWQSISDLSEFAAGFFVAALWYDKLTENQF